MRRSSLTALAFVVLALAVEAKKPSGSRPPAGSIVATAILGSPNMAITGKGKGVLVIPHKGVATVEVTLSGSLKDVTMAHIHWANASAGNPIIVDLLPRLNSSKPVLLDPPLSYKGTLSFTSTFDAARVAMFSPGMTLDAFISLLSRGLLYINVHTKAVPAGAIQGTLMCKAPCSLAA